MMLAMIRLDLPSVFAYGGSIKPGCFRGKDVSIQDVYEGIGAHATGKMSLADLTELECVALPGKGSCASMYTANTMASISEALGLTVPGMASPAAADPAREAIVRRAAATLVDALENDRRPSMILTKASFENAMTVAAALGGSTNACLHVPALAGEAGIEFGLADIDRISRRTPQIAEMRPAGRFMMQDLHVEGGVPVVMRELLDAGLLDGDAMTVTGQTIGEALAAVQRSTDPQTPVLHTVADPVKRSGGYAVLWGNLAPDGAVIKVANQAANRHRGPAKVFNSEQDAFHAVSDGRIVTGDVVVLRYEGPKGGPGMPEMTHLTSAIVGAGLVEEPPSSPTADSAAAHRESRSGTSRRRRRQAARSRSSGTETWSRSMPRPAGCRSTCPTKRSPRGSPSSSTRPRATRPESSRSTRASWARRRPVPVSVREP